jgi:hypothetical protein
LPELSATLGALGIDRSHVFVQPRSVTMGGIGGGCGLLIIGYSQYDCANNVGERIYGFINFTPWAYAHCGIAVTGKPGPCSG